MIKIRSENTGRTADVGSTADRREAPLDPCEKGVPGDGGVLPLEDMGKRHWNLLAEDLPLPAAVIRTSALRSNSGWMKGFAAAHQVQLAPHGKTTLSPTLFDLQLRDRAIAIMLR